MHSKTSKDSPVLNSFDLRRQLNIDPAYESIQSFLEVVKIDDLTEPNIPLLLPRDVSSIKLQTQNLLNNYLATALCAMAVQEELIYTMLRSDSLNEEGRYTLNFCDMGETHEITVNDEVLVIRENKKVVPYYLSSPGNDIWAYILEKVYAARFGLYSLISDGHPHEVIHSFLDGEYKIFDLKQDNSENVWALIKTYFRSDEPIKNDAEPLNEYIDLNMNENKKIVIVMRQVVRNGVPERSYYRMADYKTVKVKDKLKYIKLAVIDDSYKELVKLVSKPWGEEEASTLDKTQVGPGKIWLLFEDMMKHFSTLSLNTFRFVNLKPEYNKSVLKLGLDGEHSCVLIYFEAPNPDDKYVIGVHQKNKTFFKNLKKDYQYANLRLVLIRLDEKENIKEELLGPDLRDILQKFRGKKIFSGRFESCSVSSANSMADVFLRHRLKRGKYLVALEVFWKVDYFKNINLSFVSSLNCKVEPKLISSGSNFDIVFYKTFVWYYLDILESTKGDKDNSNPQKSLKNKELDISDRARTELERAAQMHNQNKLVLPAKLNLSYLELMEGFFIVQCNYFASDVNLRLQLQIDPIFLESSFIISPELLNLLEGNILDFDQIFVDIRNPIFFFLVRRNLSVATTRTVRLESFFKECSVSRLQSAFKGEETYSLTEMTKQKYYDIALNNLYFEHLYFESMLESSVPSLRKSDKEVLQGLTKQVVKAGAADQQTQLLLNYQFGLDAHESEFLNESDLSFSFVEMNQDTLTGLVKRFGKQFSRMGDLNFEYQIKEYILHSDNFLAILVENKEPSVVYTERREFDLFNLCVDSQKTEKEQSSYVQKKSADLHSTPAVEFVLTPKQTKLIILNAIDSKIAYRYKYKIKYKVARLPR